MDRVSHAVTMQQYTGVVVVEGWMKGAEIKRRKESEEGRGAGWGHGLSDVGKIQR